MPKEEKDQLKEIKTDSSGNEARQESSETENKEKEVADMLAKMVEKTAQLEEEAKKNYELYLRSLADLENYRKRAAKEKEEYTHFANLNILKKILGIVDDLERAMANTDDEKKDYDTLKKGLEIISRNVADLLKGEEVHAIEALGKPFDPKYHQPLITEPSDEYPAHTVIHEFQKGYIYKDRVIRPSLVKVSEEK